MISEREGSVGGEAFEHPPASSIAAALALMKPARSMPSSHPALPRLPRPGSRPQLEPGLARPNRDWLARGGKQDKVAGAAARGPGRKNQAGRFGALGCGASAQDGGRGPVGTAAVAQLGACLGCVGAGHLLERVVPLALGGFELRLEPVGRGAQVIAALARRFGEGRVGEVGRIFDPVRSSSALIWRSRSVAMFSNSRIMCSRSATLRAFSSASNRFSLRADSRAFIVRYPGLTRTLMAVETRSVP